MNTVYVANGLQSVDVHTKRLVGEVMNLIEASLPDNSPTTALKKSIKQAIWRSSRNIQVDMNSMIIE